MIGSSEQARPRPLFLGDSYANVQKEVLGARLFLRLAWRNLWRHRRRTLIVVLAIGIGMWMMMVYDGLLAGFEQAIYGNAIKVLGGNIQIYASGYHAQTGATPLLALNNDQAVVTAARSLPQVVAATRRISTGGLATSHEGAFAVSIVGIEPEQELPVSLVAQHVSAGRYLKADDGDVIFVGKGLVDAMDVKVGDRITLVGQAPHNQMRQRTMTIAGVYDIGMTDIEKRTVYMSLAEAQNLYDLNGQSTEIAISLHKLGEEPAVLSALAARVPGYEMDSWQTSFPEMQQALQAKGGVMTIFSIIILVIAAIGILNLLLMAVYERTREIGLLGALGMKPGQISILFLLEGGMMGLVGLAFGVMLGLAFNFWLSQVGFDYSTWSGMTSYTALLSSRVYSTLGLENLAQRGLIVLIISVLAAFYPAREAARHEPAAALHFV